MLSFSDSPLLNPDLSPAPPAMGVGGVEVGFITRCPAVTPTPPAFVVGVSIARSSREEAADSYQGGRSGLRCRECSSEPASSGFPRSSG